MPGYFPEGDTALATDTVERSLQKINNLLSTGAISLSDRVLLLQWAAGDNYEFTSTTYDVDGVVTSATVRWPDEEVGVFTTISKNATFLTVDAYTVTHAGMGLTVTQAAVTRDADGRITVKPELSIA